MDTQTFLGQLRTFDKEMNLIFDIGDRSVALGYHVAEVKAVTVQSMDCGGRANAWNETVVQLWAPGSRRDEGYMTVGKFLGIYGRVAASVPIDGQAVPRFEYGDVGEPAIGYLVSGVDVEGNDARVSLNAPGVACKVKSPDIQDIPMLGVTPGTCCAPNEQVSSCCG